jgi:phosphoribosylformylglycinamidine synthase
VPGDPGDDIGALYSESNSRFLVSVSPSDAPAFEQALGGSACARVGLVSSGSRLLVRGRDGRLLMRESLEVLRRRWKERLE